MEGITIATGSKQRAEREKCGRRGSVVAAATATATAAVAESGSTEYCRL